jgi:hypothetical protein
MATLSPPPVYEDFSLPVEPPSRWGRLIPRSRKGKGAIAGGLAVVLVAGFLGATYETSPGGTLWGVTKAVFPGHAQDVALTAVVNDLKKAQDILGSGQQPTPDQLTDARTSLNQAKQGLDYLSASPERTSMQNLYLQLTQQLLQYTPDSVQQLTALPAPPPAPEAPDAELLSASAPTWGYAAPGDDDYVPPPPDIPADPVADWPQPADPPLTPNLGYLGYYDPSWGQLYGYNPTSWYNYDLGGYNQYGYDFVGFDRWGYDRWGYDRWGYDHWGYNWAGYNWAGYDRGGWDRGGRNEWGQRRDHPGDPRKQDWYDRHHPYKQYYQWKFQNHNPVYRRTQWNRAHGFNPNLYQNWNMNRDWHNPRNRDWAPPATVNSVTNVNIHASLPVVNLNASLSQFISNDKATNTGPQLKDLADRSARDFTRELNPRSAAPVDSPPLSTLRTRSDTPKENHQTSLAPPALTAPEPTTPPSKVSPGFTAPKLSPVPAYTPPTVNQPRKKPEPAPENIAPGTDPDHSAGQMPAPPKAGSPDRAGAPPWEQKPEGPSNPAMTPPDEPKAGSPNPVEAPPREDSPSHRGDPAPQAPAPEAPAHPTTPKQEDRPQQQTAPESPAQPAPAPEAKAPAPAPEAPVQQAPSRQESPTGQEPPTHEAPVQQQPPREAPAYQAPARQQRPREAPPAREAPRSAPEPRQAPAEPRAKGPKCSISMC